MLVGVTLTVESGPQMGAEFHIAAPRTSIVDRSSDCDFAVLGDPEPLSVSRMHCRIDVTACDVRICDAGSCKGTFVNGYSITTDNSIPMSDGDVIIIGGTRLRVTVHSEASIEPPVPSHSMFAAARLIPIGGLSWFQSFID